MSQSSSSGGGLSLPGLLGLLFIALKLLGKIDWPWIWVLAPFWIGILLILIVGVAIALLGSRR